MTRPDPEYDVAVVGGGPAGASCAAFCAKAGIRLIILERAVFPREKVCGDCLNPVAWPVLDRLNLIGRIRELPHSDLSEVEFVGCDDRKLTVKLPRSPYGEIALKRSALDYLLLQRAKELGADVLPEATVTGVRCTETGWFLESSRGPVRARFLVAADGRNSTVARLLGLQPATRRDRVGLQTHIPLPAEMRERVRMQFVPQGYTGLADVGESQGNLCLVARPENIRRLREWAIDRYQLPESQPWRTITPLSRRPIHPKSRKLLLVGDAARVVEPFTGEGIAYALASGELAAEALKKGNLDCYHSAHRALYRGRLWLNQLAKIACLRPDLATIFLSIAAHHPALLQMLTRKVIGGATGG